MSRLKIRMIYHPFMKIFFYRTKYIKLEIKNLCVFNIFWLKKERHTSNNIQESLWTLTCSYDVCGMADVCSLVTFFNIVNCQRWWYYRWSTILCRQGTSCAESFFWISSNLTGPVDRCISWVSSYSTVNSDCFTNVDRIGCLTNSYCWGTC